MASQRKYKCPCCNNRMTRSDLVKHVEKKHEDMIPEGYTAGQLVFDSINNKQGHGECRVCKSPTTWNEKTQRYNTLCSNPKCKEHMREEYKKNMLRVKGTYNILNDPEQQQKMLANRKISGSYTFSDGGVVTYTGTYEKACLEFMDVVMEIDSKDLYSPGPTMEYMYNGEKHIYIPDFYYEPYNLIIEVKDGGDNMNQKSSPSMIASREKTIEKERVVTDRGEYNYIRLTNNDFAQLIEIFMALKAQYMAGNNDVKIVRVHESVINESLENTSPFNKPIKNIAANSIYNSLNEKDKEHIGFGYQLRNNDILYIDTIKDGLKDIAFIAVTKNQAYTYASIGSIIIAVSEQYRGNGYAKQLVEKCLKEIKNKTKIDVLLWVVDSDNIASIKLAESCGFMKCRAHNNTPQYAYRYNLRNVYKPVSGILDDNKAFNLINLFKTNIKFDPDARIRTTNQIISSKSGTLLEKAKSLCDIFKDQLLPIIVCNILIIDFSTNKLLLVCPIIATTFDFKTFTLFDLSKRYFKNITTIQINNPNLSYSDFIKGYIFDNISNAMDILKDHKITITDKIAVKAGCEQDIEDNIIPSIRFAKAIRESYINTEDMAGITDVKIVRVHESVINESLETTLTTNPLEREIQLFHGSPLKLDIIKPESFNAGTRLSSPRCSSFWSDNEYTAALFGLFRLGEENGLVIKFKPDLSGLLVKPSEYHKAIKLFTTTPVYIYSKILNKKYIGIGHSNYFPEYTVDCNVVPDNCITYLLKDYDIIDTFSSDDDQEIRSQVKQNIEMMSSMTKGGIPRKLIARDLSSFKTISKEYRKGQLMNTRESTVLNELSRFKPNQMTEYLEVGLRESDELTPKSTVYFLRSLDPEVVHQAITSVIDTSQSQRLAIKLHSGEFGNKNFIGPDFWKPLLNDIGGTIVECNTAYKGSRDTTEKHLETMRKHGWSKYFNVDIMDSEYPDIVLPVKKGTVLDSNLVGNHLKNYDTMLVLSHFKGHTMGGYGGALKNISIGIASSEGKCKIHRFPAGTDMASVKPTDFDQDEFVEAIAEAAGTVVDYFGDNIAFVNVMKNISVDCDCDAHAHAPCMKDIGVLISNDPVAIDAACVDLIYSSTDPGAKQIIERIESRHGFHAIEHAASLGIGNRNYNLIDITDRFVIEESTMLESNNKYKVVDIRSNKKLVCETIKDSDPSYIPLIDNYDGELIFDGNTLIGQVFIDNKKDVGFVSGVWVHPDYRRQGIGTQLINDAKSKYGAVDLTVYDDSPGAKAMYEKNGFKVRSVGKGETGRFYYMKIDESFLDEYMDNECEEESSIDDIPELSADVDPYSYEQNHPVSEGVIKNTINKTAKYKDVCKVVKAKLDKKDFNTSSAISAIKNELDLNKIYYTDTIIVSKYGVKIGENINIGAELMGSLVSLNAQFIYTLESAAKNMKLKNISITHVIDLAGPAKMVRKVLDACKSKSINSFKSNHNGSKLNIQLACSRDEAEEIASNFANTKVKGVAKVQTIIVDLSDSTTNESAVLEYSDINQAPYESSGKSLYDDIRNNIKYRSTGRLQSPKETVLNGYGDCHDQAYLVWYKLNQMGYKCGRLLLLEYEDWNSPGGRTHTAVWYKAGGKYFWFETAWENEAGIHGPYRSFEALEKGIKDAWKFQGNYNKLYMGPVKKSIPHMTLDQYMVYNLPSIEPKPCKVASRQDPKYHNSLNVKDLFGFDII